MCIAAASERYLSNFFGLAKVAGSRQTATARFAIAPAFECGKGGCTTSFTKFFAVVNASHANAFACALTPQLRLWNKEVFLAEEI